ncbi:alpha/beta hydrolase family protein [Kitasatospora sp. NBC_01266]|uniref:alpha/beta hydrolase family protein n=1 Tax=Kitasatospora sp. NBC_01266 TaxID=2903572 RepID=UPI002E325AB8|nr:alpha/beta fold hydrolase [Kitasatospora sp. NBC_01266]
MLTRTRTRTRLGVGLGAGARTRTQAPSPRPIAAGRTPLGARTSFAFAANAEYAACLTTDRRGGLVPEHWSFDGPSARRRALPLDETVRTQPLPTEDGRLLLLRGGAGRHELVLADPRSGPVGEPLVVAGRALRLVATPEPGSLALAIGADGPGHSVLHRVLDGPLRLAPAATLPGAVGAVCRLDPVGRLLGVALRSDGRTRAVIVDLGDGSHRPLSDEPGQQGLGLLLASPASGLLLTTLPTPDGPRLAWATLADPAEGRVPQRLNAIEGAVRPLAFDPAGERVALRVVHGARSRLLVHELRTDRITEVPLPEGAIHPVAGWGRTGLRLPVSTAERPAEIAVLTPDARAVRRPVRRRSATAARVERFHGPAGEFEAVCRGDWRGAATVLVALHGGPEAAWDLGFDPLLHRLAAAGIAVVAPNQRGSIRYGAAHAEAIHGAWGGPDLADIRSLLRTLVAARPGSAPAPMLYGGSYGGYLALLAAAADPRSWSRCAAVAPFLSGARLHEQATPAVRALIDRLGGRTEPAAVADDELGPRDVWALADRIRARLLIMHGADDPVIPVDQTRQLRQRLRDLGRTEGTDFHYAEVPGGGHSPLEGFAGAPLREYLLEFLTAPAEDRSAH